VHPTWRFTKRKSLRVWGQKKEGRLSTRKEKDGGWNSQAKAKKYHNEPYWNVLLRGRGGRAVKGEGGVCSYEQDRKGLEHGHYVITNFRPQWRNPLNTNASPETGWDEEEIGKSMKSVGKGGGGGGSTQVILRGPERRKFSKIQGRMGFQEPHRNEKGWKGTRLSGV